MALEALKTIPLFGNIKVDSRPGTMITAIYGIKSISIRYQITSIRALQDF